MRHPVSLARAGASPFEMPQRARRPRRSVIVYSFGPDSGLGLCVAKITCGSDGGRASHPPRFSAPVAGVVFLCGFSHSGRSARLGLPPDEGQRPVPSGRAGPLDRSTRTEFGVACVPPDALTSSGAAMRLKREVSHSGCKHECVGHGARLTPCTRCGRQTLPGGGRETKRSRSVLGFQMVNVGKCHHAWTIRLSDWRLSSDPGLRPK